MQIELWLQSIFKVLDWKLNYFRSCLQLSNLVSNFLQSSICQRSVVELAQFFSKIIKQLSLSPLDAKYCCLILKLKLIFADQRVPEALINSSIVFKLNLALYTVSGSKIVRSYFAVFIMITWSQFNFISQLSYH